MFSRKLDGKLEDAFCWESSDELVVKYHLIMATFIVPVWHVESVGINYYVSHNHNNILWKYLVQFLHKHGLVFLLLFYWCKTMNKCWESPEFFLYGKAAETRDNSVSDFSCLLISLFHSFKRSSYSQSFSDLFISHGWYQLLFCIFSFHTDWKWTLYFLQNWLGLYSCIAKDTLECFLNDQGNYQF